MDTRIRGYDRQMMRVILRVLVIPTKVGIYLPDSEDTSLRGYDIFFGCLGLPQLHQQILKIFWGFRIEA